MALHSPSRSIWFFTILLGVWHLAPSASIHAFNTDTHAPLSELAASHYQCRMEEFVIGQLGEQKGLRTRAIVLDDVYKLPVPGSRYATNYLGALIMGAIDEDSEQGAGRDFLDSVPDTISRARMGNHFYCPTRIEKGFRDKAFNDVFEGVLRGYSWWTGKHLPAVDSLHWAWDHRGASPTPRGYENFSWQHARRQYYFWLTEMNPSERDWRAGETFYALGHVIHLVQDLAQPQHTRNDGHSQPQWYGQLSVGDDSQFEKYCSAKYGNIDEVKGLLRKLPTSQIPIFKHLPTTNSDGIPPELRAFWDTGQLNGNEEDKRQNPFNKLYEDDLGLAEFSNSFFVTSDTMFTGHYAEFTYPDVSGRKFLVHNFLWDYDYDAHFFPYPRVTDLYGLGALWPPHNQPTDFLFRRIPENILVDSVTVGVNRLSPDISDFCSAATSTHPSGQLSTLCRSGRLLAGAHC